MQATLVGLQATLEQTHAMQEQTLAAVQRLGQLQQVTAYNSMARVRNSFAQLGSSTLTPIMSDAAEHISFRCQKP